MRHCGEHLFGGAGDGGDHHDGEGYTSRECGEVLLGHDDERVDGDAHHDGGDAVEDIGGEADCVAKEGTLAKLREIDAGGDAEGDAHQAGELRMIPEPTMELAMPPPDSPTGAGMWVKNARLRELAPL